MKQFSKRLLRLDYIITILMLISFFVCVLINGIYGINFDINTFGIIICSWIAQLGVSSAAYYMLIKSEHKIELPMRLINELPEDIQDKVDLTQIITTVLTSTDN